jgi:hypothetical protein
MAQADLVPDQNVNFPADRKLDHHDGKRYSKACGFSANPATSEQDNKPIIQLWQINSKGNLSRCYLSIPIESVDDVIALLQRTKS